MLVCLSGIGCIVLAFGESHKNLNFWLHLGKRKRGKERYLATVACIPGWQQQAGTEQKCGASDLLQSP